MAPGAPVGAPVGALAGADGASAARGPGAGEPPGRPVAGGRTPGPAGPGPLGPCRWGAPGRAGAPGGTGPPCRMGGPHRGGAVRPPVPGIPCPGVGGPGVVGLGVAGRGPGGAWGRNACGAAGGGVARTAVVGASTAFGGADVGAEVGVEAAPGRRCGVVPWLTSSPASGAAGAGCGAVPSGATSSAVSGDSTAGASTAGASTRRGIDRRGVLRRLGLVDGRGRQGHHGRAVRPPGRRPGRRSHPGRRDPLPPPAGAVQPRDALDVARGRDPAEVAGAEHQSRSPPGSGGAGRGDERLRGQVPTPDVAARHAGAGDGDLADPARRAARAAGRRGRR